MKSLIEHSSWFSFWTGWCLTTGFWMLDKGRPLYMGLVMFAGTIINGYFWYENKRKEDKNE